jgi:hypothetical protein
MEFSILIGCSTADENILRLENILIYYGAATWTNQHVYYILIVGLSKFIYLF